MVAVFSENCSLFLFHTIITILKYLYLSLSEMIDSLFVAELLCCRRPREWSPILILRGVLVTFHGHGKRNGSRARAPYVRTWHFMTFFIGSNFRAAYSQWCARNCVSLLMRVAQATRVAIK